jgi:hypothetical protein
MAQCNLEMADLTNADLVNPPPHPPLSPFPPTLFPSLPQDANIAQCNLEMADLTNADLVNPPPHPPLSPFPPTIFPSLPQDANMAQCNLEMADLTNADLTNADLTNAYLTGAVLNGPKGGLTKIENTDWTDAELRCVSLVSLSQYLTGAVLNGQKGGLTKIENTDWTDAELRCVSRVALVFSLVPPAKMFRHSTRAAVHGRLRQPCRTRRAWARRCDVDVPGQAGSATEAVQSAVPPADAAGQAYRGKQLE